MGNIFYALMAKSYPYEDLSKKKAQKAIMQGERPLLNETITNSKDKALPKTYSESREMQQ